jgi:hypothetical protein
MGTRTLSSIATIEAKITFIALSLTSAGTSVFLAESLSSVTSLAYTTSINHRLRSIERIRLTAMSSKKRLMFSKLSLMKGFITVIKGSFRPNLTPLAKFCKIFAMSVSVRLALSLGRSVITLVHLTSNHSHAYHSRARFHWARRWLDNTDARRAWNQ